MRTLDDLIAQAKRSPGPPAQVHDFQLAHDYETIKRFTALCTRYVRSGSFADVDGLEKWLFTLYRDVSERQEQLR